VLETLPSLVSEPSPAAGGLPAAWLLENVPQACSASEACLNDKVHLASTEVPRLRYMIRRCLQIGRPTAGLSKRPLEFYESQRLHKINGRVRCHGRLQAAQGVWAQLGRPGRRGV
jgi:hypothetical protein